MRRFVNMHLVLQVSLPISLCNRWIQQSWVCGPMVWSLLAVYLSKVMASRQAQRP